MLLEVNFYQSQNWSNFFRVYISEIIHFLSNYLLKLKIKDI